MCAYKYIYLPAHCLKVVVYSCVQESAAGVIVSWCSPCVGKTLVVLITCRLLITWLCNGPSTVAASHSFDAMSLSSHGWSLASVTNFFFRVSAAWIINQWNLSNPRCMGLVTWLGAVLLHSLTSSRGLNCANFRYVSGNTMRRRWWVFVLLAIWKKKKQSEEPCFIGCLTPIAIACSSCIPVLNRVMYRADYVDVVRNQVRIS